MLAQRDAGSLSRLQVTNGLRARVEGGWEEGATGLIVGAEIPAAAAARVAADLLYSRPNELGSL